MLWRNCANCGAQMHISQDWCLQCGAGAPDSLLAGTPRWRSGATIAGAVAILVAGAAAAAYAALNRSPAKPRPLITAVAGVPTPATALPTPATALPTPATTPTTGAKTGVTGATKPLPPLGLAKPPKIPLVAATPKIPAAVTPLGSPAATTPAATTPASTTPAGSTTTGEPVLLDTNAAATYNPYAYAASEFGDPTLAIDGDTSTAWSARVNPAVAPRMAEGLVIDLNSAHKLATLKLVTSTPGMTVQVYGTSAAKLPVSITDHSWVPLSSRFDVKNRHTKVKLRDSTKAYHFVTLWISKAPIASVGTAAEPGHVSVNEVELFPATG
jgi:subtilase-type serine protease